MLVRANREDPDQTVDLGGGGGGGGGALFV